MVNSKLRNRQCRFLKFWNQAITFLGTWGPNAKVGRLRICALPLTDVITCVILTPLLWEIIVWFTTAFGLIIQRLRVYLRKFRCLMARLVNSRVRRILKLRLTYYNSLDRKTLLPNLITVESF